MSLLQIDLLKMEYTFGFRGAEVASHSQQPLLAAARPRARRSLTKSYAGCQGEGWRKNFKKEHSFIVCSHTAAQLLFWHCMLSTFEKVNSICNAFSQLCANLACAVVCSTNYSTNCYPLLLYSRECLPPAHQQIRSDTSIFLFSWLHPYPSQDYFSSMARE